MAAKRLRGACGASGVGLTRFGNIVQVGYRHKQTRGIGKFQEIAHPFIAHATLSAPTLARTRTRPRGSARAHIDCKIPNAEIDEV
ncbi:hypothetical protein EVAR_78312_1 [Eumeta japonica]|uniref:Uncharacterized protein n=1 Tax=Eumeta variegata TaxID=151549 RepID=A0A4C1T360_EUMVA|nr:hypothetical protein EVAR_78312_1 [Eumeta japonica]